MANSISIYVTVEDNFFEEVIVSPKSEDGWAESYEEAHEKALSKICDYTVKSDMIEPIHVNILMESDFENWPIAEIKMLVYLDKYNKIWLY